MKYLLQSLVVFLAILSPLEAAALSGNTISADGTYTVTTFPGKKYTFAAGGTFGGGSLALNWHDQSGNTGALGDSPSTAAETYTFTAPTNQVDLVLTGSTDPTISISLTLADGTPNDIEDIAGLQAELDEKSSVDVLAEIDAINTQPNSVSKVALWSASNAAPVRFALFGDSYVDGFTLGPKMADAGAFNAGFVTSSGTASTNNANGSGLPKTYNYWLNGVVTSVPASSEGTFCNGDVAPVYRRGNRWTMYYIKGPTMATSFDLEWESSNNPGVWTLFTTGANGVDGDNVSAFNASDIGAVFTATLSETSTPSYKVRVKNIVGGPLVFCLAGIYHTSGGGVISIGGLSDGGVDLTSVITTPSAVYTPILKDMAIDCLLSCWADGATEWETGGAFRTFATNLDAANTFTAGTGATYADNGGTAGVDESKTITYASNTSVRQGMFVSGTGIPAGARVASITSATECILNVGATAVASGLTFTFRTKPDWITVSANPALVETGRPETRASQRAWSVENSQTYLNGHSMFIDYATGLAKGLCSSDGTHLTTIGKAFRNQNIWSKLPLGSLYLGADRTPIGINSQKVGLAQLGSQFQEFPSGVHSTGSGSGFYWSDQNFPQYGSLIWSATVATNVWEIKKGSSSYFKVSGASDGTAGVRPGFDGMDLGNAANRWRAYLHNTNITGTHILVPDTLSGAGAIPITTPTTAFTSTGASQALTLANGTAGQVKTIVHDVDGGSGILTPTTKTGFSAITFTAVGETVTLQYFTTRGWMVIGSYGVTIAP